MDSLTFRPELHGLEDRHTPSATPTQVLNAMQHTQYTTEYLRAFQNDLTMARTPGEIRAVAAAMTALANQSAESTRIMGDFTADLMNQINANPAGSATLVPLARASATIQYQALLNMATAHLDGVGFGAPESGFNLVTSPVVPPTPLPPAVPPVTVPPPAAVTTTDSAGMTSTFPDPNDSRFKDLGDGVKYYDVVQGQGTPVQASDTVKVFYTLWNAGTGQEIQTNRNGSPFTSPLSGLIKGWQEAIPGMQPGGIRRLYVPSEKGYGASGSGADIPPNTNLVFEVKLLTP